MALVSRFVSVGRGRIGNQSARLCQSQQLQLQRPLLVTSTFSTKYKNSHNTCSANINISSCNLNLLNTRGFASTSEDTGADVAEALSVPHFRKGIPEKALVKKGETSSGEKADVPKMVRKPSVKVNLLKKFGYLLRM